MVFPSQHFANKKAMIAPVSTAKVIIRNTPTKPTNELLR